MTGCIRSMIRVRARSNRLACALPRSTSATARASTMTSGSWVLPRRAIFQVPLAMKDRALQPNLERGGKNVTHALGIFQNPARAQRDAGQRIVGNGDRQAGFVTQHRIEIGEERA